MSMTLTAEEIEAHRQAYAARWCVAPERVVIRVTEFGVLTFQIRSAR